MSNNEIVECVDKYRYLGSILDEHLDFNIIVTVLFFLISNVQCKIRIKNY